VISFLVCVPAFGYSEREDFCCVPEDVPEDEQRGECDSDDGSQDFSGGFHSVLLPANLGSLR